MSRANAVYVCGGYYRPGARDACPNVLHDWTLPPGYIEASDVATSRMYRKWTNKKCPDCGRYGWLPGRIDASMDHQRTYQ